MPTIKNFRKEFGSESAERLDALLNMEKAARNKYFGSAVSKKEIKSFATALVAFHPKRVAKIKLGKARRIARDFTNRQLGKVELTLMDDLTNVTVYSKGMPILAALSEGFQDKFSFVMPHSAHR